MTAKKMFEELGLYYQEVKRNNEITKIIYKNSEEMDTQIEFQILSNGKIDTFYCYYIGFRKTTKPGFVDKHLFKAIQKQIEELGW